METDKSGGNMNPLMYGGVKRRDPLKPIIMGYPLQLVVVDIIGPLSETSNGNKHILVAEDYFTRWLEAWPIPNQETKTVAEKLLNEMFFISLYQIRFCPTRVANLKVHLLQNYVMYHRYRNLELHLIIPKRMDW